MAEFGVIREIDDYKFAKKMTELVEKGFVIISCTRASECHFGYIMRK